MFIAKNNDLIILAKETRKELEQALTCMVYTSIEETDVKYELYNGKYITDEEKQQAEKQARNVEIDSKIKELQEMALPELLHGNTANVKIYNDVIASLLENKS